MTLHSRCGRGLTIIVDLSISLGEFLSLSDLSGGRIPTKEFDPRERHVEFYGRLHVVTVFGGVWFTSFGYRSLSKTPSNIYRKWALFFYSPLARVRVGTKWRHPGGWIAGVLSFYG